MDAIPSLDEGLAALMTCQQAALRDPYPFYARLRSENPVHPLETNGIRRWLLSRYDDIAGVLRDPRFSADPNTGSGLHAMMEQLPEPSRSHGLAVVEYLSLWMLTRDGTDHARLRGLANKAFTPRVVTAMHAHIQSLVDELLDAVAPTGTMDVMADVANVLPTRVIAELLGVPPEDRERLRFWSNGFAIFLDGGREPDLAYRCVEEFHAYLRPIIAERRARPQSDLLSALIAAEEQGTSFTEDELIAMTELLLGAGYETTTSLIGNGMLALLRHPDQLALLRDRPELIDGAVEEILRYDSPIQMTHRTPVTAVEVGGTTIPAGEMTTVLLGAANRDPAHVTDPERFDITRTGTRMLAFGFGPHFCLGSALARLEGQIAIATMVRRLPDIQLTTDDLRWRENLSFRNVQALPVTFTPSA